MPTLSVFKACAGGYVGSGGVHPALVDAVREAASEARGDGIVDDTFVSRCGDDLVLVCLHPGPIGSSAVAAAAWAAFSRAGASAVRLGQHLAVTNGGLAVDAVEIAVGDRCDEPVVCLLADKAGPGAFDVHLYRAFADPFNTPGLLDDPAMAEGFEFVCVDPSGGQRTFSLPDELHGFLASVSREEHVVREVRTRSTGRVAAVVSTGGDPVLSVRCHDGFPTVGEVLEAFAFPYSVAGWCGVGPLMPVSTIDDAATRLDGPPRVIGLGFQVTAGRLVGPRDLLGDRAFDEARREALRAADYLRRHGPFAGRGNVRGPAARTPIL